MKPLRVTLAALTCAALAAVLAPSSPAVSAGDQAPAAKAAPAKRYLYPGRVGQVTARMTKAQAVATGEMVADTPGACEGTTVPLRPTYPFNREYAVFVDEGGRITEMDVFGKHVRTPKAIGVGNTVAAVKKIYGAKLSAPKNIGYEQWGRFVSYGTGPNRLWIGFLFGEALVADGPLRSTDKITLVGVTRGSVRPALMIDGC
ncbi:hypothetical protein [Nocardioides plantarum]|uniref:Uncharacterized protein n=1 Tax=Nocardioides plantarum TaxID=29299 RepID=A0ABV5KEH0_9ACTN|nr:hypothetical protein [Nocardioides plantarum]